MIPLCMRLGNIVTDESKGQTPEFPRDRPLNFQSITEALIVKATLGKTETSSRSGNYIEKVS